MPTTPVAPDIRAAAEDTGGTKGTVIMKKKIWNIGIMGVCMLCICAGCGKDNGGEATEEAVLTSETEKNTETGNLIEKYELDILSVVCVEAGTDRLTEEMFFDSYTGQEIVIGQELSAEELAVYGASYQIPVTYSGYDLEIEVDIIDTTAPVIEKLDDILAKAGGTIAYKKAITYSDNSSNELTLSIDNSAVDVETPGEYSVIYTVMDAAGNSSQIEVGLTVIEASSHTEEDVKDLALAVLDEVVDPDASQYDNALALFRWVHGNIRYTHSSGDRSSVWAGAYEGLHDRYGDCYAFYATYAVLLTYAGIPNECVARVSDSSNHWWNLVNTGDGWYHCDTSPRRNGDGYFCFMQTDAQVAAYTRAYPEKPDYYTFDGSLLPERATTIIYGYDPDTIYQKYNTDAIKQRHEGQTSNAEENESEQTTEETETDTGNSKKKDKNKKKDKDKKEENDKDKEKEETTTETQTEEDTETPETTEIPETTESQETTESTETGENEAETSPETDAETSGTDETAAEAALSDTE
jgi:transglutaminase-like putative cysteine protease